MAHVQHAGRVLSAGLELLYGFNEAQAKAVLRGVRLKPKSGLRIPVSDDLRDQAEHLRRRFSRQAAVNGQKPWTARRVLLCAMVVASSQPFRDDWDKAAPAGKSRG